MNAYYLGHYNVCVEDPARDKMAIYNTMTSAMVRLPARDGKPLINTLSASDISQLHRLMILVPSYEHEQRMFEYWSRRNRFGHRSLVATLFATRHCNLKCTYCYQAQEALGVPIQDMSEEVSETTFDWIERYALARQISNVHLILYGGEPLANPSFIAVLRERMDAMMHRTNVRYSSYLVTNATMVSSEILDDLLKCHLVHAQVTLDGPESLHDSRRRKADGSGSYAETVGGLQLLAEACDISIRCNVEPNTADEVRMLIRDLKDLGVAVRPNSFSIAGTCYCSHDAPQMASRFSAEEFAIYAVGLLRYARDHGFVIRHPYRQSPCFAAREGSFTFDVDGGIYLCSQMAGYEVARVGDVRQVDLKDAYFQLLTLDARMAHCCECQYLPICLGGCRASSVRETGKLDSTVCIRDYYDAVVPRMIGLLSEN
jgi:uncharacterized protein